MAGYDLGKSLVAPDGAGASHISAGSGTYSLIGCRHGSPVTGTWA
jgi:hypothetical protein